MFWLDMSSWLSCQMLFILMNSAISVFRFMKLLSVYPAVVVILFATNLYVRLFTSSIVVFEEINIKD